ncbi:FxLYD domain-containing protein [Paraclostridium sordellii]|uniref:FxLYD domain-containing protein n=1 Tax=Paraclostridium sordellii TaxID=1505 RepID=UPI00241C89F9
MTGVIKNNSGRDCTYVQVTFNLYDTDGNQVGTALANINNLEKDGTWKFKAMGMNVDGQVSSYKLADITGY